MLRQVQPRLRTLSISLCRGVASTTPSPTRPVPVVSAGKDMKVLLGACLKEEQERQATRAREKAKAKTTKQKAAESSCSRESTTANCYVGEQPSSKVKATSKGKQPTQKGSAKAATKAVSAANPKGKRRLEEPVQWTMAPPQSTPDARVNRQASRPSQASTVASNVRFTASVRASVRRKIAAGAEEVSTTSESERSLPAKSKPKEISMA